MIDIVNQQECDESLDTQAVSESVFAVFFTANLSNLDTRLAILRRYIREGLGAEVRVLDHAVLQPGTGGYCMLMVVSAASQTAVEAAIAPCNVSYHTTIVKADQATVNPDSVAVNYCLLGWDDEAAQPPLLADRESVLGSVTVKIWLELPEGSPCKCVWLLDAPTALNARDYGAHTREPTTTIACIAATEPAVYFRQTILLANAKAESEALTAVVAADAAPLIVINRDSSPAVCGSLAPGQPYPSLFASRQAVGAGQSSALGSDVYVWRTMSETFTYWELVTVTKDGFPETTPVQKQVTSNSPDPVLSTSYSPGVTMSFNLSQGGGFQIVTDLLTWLDKLLNTQTFHKPWPEDSYSGEEKAAYQFILSKIDGQTPPNRGTVKPGIIDAILFEENHGFTGDSFDFVKSHLLDECTYFEYSADWFGVNGAFAVINTQIANSATNSLIGAAALFSIPQTSTLSVIMDAIMDIIIAVVAAIPDEGPFIAAAITVAWSTAKLAEGGSGESTIQGTVAELTERLTNYLQGMVNATATQLSTINSNWGTLHEFASQVIEGKLSLAQFGMEQPAQPGDKPNPSKGYITAAAKAWSIIVYQALFAIPEGNSPGTPSHQAFRFSNLTSTPPENPWNPAEGNYQFVYYLPCSYKDNCGNPANGYLGYTCASNAPTEVMKALFGPDSSINLNPFEFFIGYNGWPPAVDESYLSGDLLSLG
jgi:hypothetical protein